MDVSTARSVLSIVFDIGIGLIMALLFYRDDQAHNESLNNGDLFAGQGSASTAVIVFMLLLVALLVVSTLGITVFTNHYVQMTLMVPGVDQVETALYYLIP
jgi:hypothetical protein